MKKILLCLSLYFLCSNVSFAAEPLVLNDSADYPIKFVWDELPAVIGKPVEIKLQYVWRYWSKSAFAPPSGRRRRRRGGGG